MFGFFIPNDGMSLISIAAPHIAHFCKVKAFMHLVCSEVQRKNSNLITEPGNAIVIQSTFGFPLRRRTQADAICYWLFVVSPPSWGK